MRHVNVPEGWDLHKVSKVLTIKHGKSQREIVSPHGKFPVLATGGEIGRTNTPIYTKPSVLIGRKGTIDKPQYMESPFWTVDTLFYSEIKSSIIPKYIFYLFQTINWQMFNEGSTLPSLSANTIMNIKILIPPIKEQKKIAGILGTWDRAIEELTGLIAEKKELKRGLMQRLLTGTQRLSGFIIPWNQRKISEFVQIGKIIIEKGYTLTAEQLNTGDIPVIAGGKTVPYYHNKYTHDIPCITVSASGAYAGYVWWHNSKIWASDCNVLYGVNFDTRFLGFCLKNMQKQIYRMQTGGAQPHVYADSIKTLKIPDIDLAEQKAIADVLSKADSEIDLLNQQLSVLKEQKRGLMQKLLTGEIRVKVDDK